MAKIKRPPPQTGLATLSVFDLRRELAARQRRARALDRHRARVLAKIAAIEAEISRLGVVPQGGAYARGSNEESLAVFLHRLLKGKTMSVTQAAEGVRDAGYKSASKNFPAVVALALRHPAKFKRVSRGKYTSR